MPEALESVRTVSLERQARALRVACRLSPANLILAETVFGPCAVQFATDSELVHFVEDNGVRGVVWEATRDVPARLVGISDRMASFRQVPTVIVTDVGDEHTNAIVAAAFRAYCVHICVNRRDDVVDALRALKAELADHTSEQAIIRMLVPAVQISALSVFVAAAIVSRRRTTVRELARFCHVSTDTVEHRLRFAGGPMPRDLLGSLVSLHAIWRYGILKRSVKQVAADMSFPNATALGNYVHRHTSARLRHLERRGGFVELLRSITSDWADGRGLEPG